MRLNKVTACKILIVEKPVHEQESVNKKSSLVEEKERMKDYSDGRKPKALMLGDYSSESPVYVNKLLDKSRKVISSRA